MTTAMSSVADAVNESWADLALSRDDDVAVAISGALSPSVAGELARNLSQHMDAISLPHRQRAWIVASNAEDRALAQLLASLAETIGAARLQLHDPRDPDALYFQRRIPGQRRGGIYLNAAWQSASVRIGCGHPLELAVGLSAWFNKPADLRPDDLGASLLL